MVAFFAKSFIISASFISPHRKTATGSDSMRSSTGALKLLMRLACDAENPVFLKVGPDACLNARSRKQSARREA
jgi:hypothetical protein